MQFTFQKAEQPASTANAIDRQLLARASCVMRYARERKLQRSRHKWIFCISSFCDRGVEAASKSTLTESDTTAEDRFSYGNLVGIAGETKVSLFAGDLYGPAVNTAIKNASCYKALFDALLL